MALYNIFFETQYLLLQLLKIDAKTLVLILKLVRSEYRCRKLLLQRGILVIRQLNAFLQDDRRAMLVDKLFNPIKQPHVGSLELHTFELIGCRRLRGLAPEETI